jgi:hypothetical protein
VLDESRGVNALAEGAVYAGAAGHSVGDQAGAQKFGDHFVSCQRSGLGEKVFNRLVKAGFRGNALSFQRSQGGLGASQFVAIEGDELTQALLELFKLALFFR